MPRKPSTREDPQTPEEWQQAVDLAAGARAIADGKMYGLLEGGPEIDLERCDELIERGAALKIYPSKPWKELALELILALNSRPTLKG